MTNATFTAPPVATSPARAARRVPGRPSHPTHLYMLEAWLGFAPNLLLAEWYIRNRIRTPAAAQKRLD